MNAEKLTFEAVRAVASTGLMKDGEQLLLHQLAKMADGPGVLVEVGSWVGTSALVILAAQHELGKGPTQLFCIDNFEQNTRAGFEKNLGPHIESGEVTLLAGDSITFARQWPADRKIKFLFLDGDHQYETVKREIELFEPHLLPGAIVLFHDAYYRPQPVERPFQVRFMYRGVALAIRESIMSDRRYSGFQRAHALLTCRYNPNIDAQSGPDTDRQAFVKSYEQETTINTWPLRIAYLTYLLTSGVKHLFKWMRLEAPIRFTLRKLGFKRFFGIKI